MSYYESENAWSAQGRQPSWEQGPSRASTTTFQSDSNAFAAQFEEIERASDNLMRSGKWAPSAMPGVPGAGRRESVPMPGRHFESPSDQRGPRHNPSNSEYDGNRPGSAGLQNFYAGQRFPPPRQSDAEQILQAKRRMAAQRERELRNYHQEQQYNRTSSTAKPDRSMSPNTMSEDDRRELIARQHRALYGDGSNLYSQEAPKGQEPGRVQSPYDAYNQAQAGADGSVQMPVRDRAESSASPIGNTAAQTEKRASPAASPPLQGGGKTATSGVAPIGTRPPQSAAGLNKRSTTPMTPSSLSYGFSNADSQGSGAGIDQRSGSAASNPQPSTDKAPLGSGSAWGSGSGVWGKTSMHSQASVWG